MVMVEKHVSTDHSLVLDCYYLEVSFTESCNVAFSVNAVYSAMTKLFMVELERVFFSLQKAILSVIQCISLCSNGYTKISVLCFL